MLLQEQIRELEKARRQAKKLREKIKLLRQSIIVGGGDPDTYRPNNVERNKEIYRKLKSGMKYIEVAKQYNLSVATIRYVFSLIENILAAKDRDEKWNNYKSLLKYNKKNYSAVSRDK